MLATVFKVHKFFPIFFIQLLLGVLITNLSFFQDLIATQQINSVFWSHSFSYMGWLGIACAIALSSSEASEYHSEQGDRRFLIISVFGFFISFVLNAVVALCASSMTPNLIGTAQNTTLFALALGLSLSVTAVPVLVAITQDLKEISPLVRNTAISTALLDDLWLWLGIGLILSFPHSSGPQGHHPLLILLLLLVYLLLCFVLVKPLLARWIRKCPLSSVQQLLLVISTILLSSTTTELIGLHSIFGVFIAGLVLPTALLKAVKPALMDVCNGLLVPLFFITSGMKIQLHDLGADFVVLLLAFTVIATSTKFFAVSVISKFLGFSWNNSLVLGMLMQCKGLMELVVANVLFETGLISHTMFAILSIYALISTLCTTPLVKIIMKLIRQPEPTQSEPRGESLI